ncbi:MAG TPA: DUF1572 domain-containing protein [Bacteroidia bacterium]|nr:DUF1572 domain-containing protein [Bacteroidia bacterium]
MNLTAQIAKQLRDLHFGGNWTWSSMEEHLKDLTWKQATTHVHSLNTIATLVYHMNYYLNVVSQRIQGQLLDPKHELSFSHPPIKTQKDWEDMLTKTWRDAENFAEHIEQMPEDMLWKSISDKHGNYYRNIQGVIEHTHYHLGQIVLLKKIIAAK